MATETWLYIYEGAPRSDEERRPIYIGIGESMGRVFEQHNPDAERLRDAEGTLIRQTVEPVFEPQGRAQGRGYRHPRGLDPIYDAEDEDELFNEDDKMVTNIAGTRRASTWGRRFSRAMVRSLRMR